MPTRSNRHAVTRTGVVIGILIAFLALAGCGQPQVPLEHRELILRLATGTSTRDPGILQRVAVEIEKLDQAGALGDVQSRAFRAALDAATEGDWDRAQRLAYALRDGQRPSDEDRRRLEGRPLPPIKRPGQAAPGH